MGAVNDPEDLQLLRSRILRNAGIRKGMLVADLGSGRGFLSAGARSLGATPVAIDIDSEALGHFDGLAVTADATMTPFADGSFDAVVLRSVLVWSPVRDLIVQEAGRVLKPYCLIAGSESLNADIDIELDDLELRSVWDVVKQALDSLEPVTLSATRLEGLLLAAGLHEVRVDIETMVHVAWDPSWFFFDQRGPSGYSLAEYLVSGGFDERVISGFCDGLARTNARLITKEGLFVGRKFSEAQP